MVTVYINKQNNNNEEQYGMVLHNIKRHLEIIFTYKLHVTFSCMEIETI